MQEIDREIFIKRFLLFFNMDTYYLKKIRFISNYGTNKGDKNRSIIGQKRFLVVLMRSKRHSVNASREEIDNFYVKAKNSSQFRIF